MPLDDTCLQTLESIENATTQFSAVSDWDAKAVRCAKPNNDAEFHHFWGALASSQLMWPKLNRSFIASGAMGYAVLLRLTSPRTTISERAPQAHLGKPVYDHHASIWPVVLQLDDERQPPASSTCTLCLQKDRWRCASSAARHIFAHSWFVACQCSSSGGWRFRVAGIRHIWVSSLVSVMAGTADAAVSIH